MRQLLRKDAKELVSDIETIKKDVDTLKRDLSARLNERQIQNDLRRLATHIQNLEFDLSTMFVDCLNMGRQYWKEHNLELIDCLRQCYDSMDALFRDLDSLRTDLTQSTSKLSSLQRMKGDLNWLNKAIYQTRGASECPLRWRKNQAWARGSILEAQEMAE